MHHARIVVRDGEAVVHDLGGGVRVGGEKVAERALRDGDVLHVAGVRMQFFTDEGAQP